MAFPVQPAAEFKAKISSFTVEIERDCYWAARDAHDSYVPVVLSEKLADVFPREIARGLQVSDAVAARISQRMLAEDFTIYLAAQVYQQWDSEFRKIMIISANRFASPQFIYRKPSQN